MKTEIPNNRETWQTERQGYSRWVENGHAYEAPTVDPEKFGPHDYNKPGMRGQGKCKCGCAMWSSSSSGPVDPFGRCPENPL